MMSSRFFDPLYGRVEFTPSEMQLIRSPEVQRLRYVRMCNINSLLISGASEPSRFEHVVGVMHLAKQWTRANGVTGDEAQVFHAAALLHDVQTGPFGHSMEYILADNAVPGDFRHDDVAHGSAMTFHQDTPQASQFAGFPFAAPERLGRLWQRVAMAVTGGGPYGQMIAGRVDLDNIDNVVRLAYHVGVATTDDAKLGIKLACDLQTHAGKLSATSAGIDGLRRWQEIRRKLYSLLLHDWAEFSAKAMLTTAMEVAVQHGLIGAAEWILTDDELIQHLKDTGRGDAQQVGELAKRLQAGDLYEPLALWRTNNIDIYSDLSRVESKRQFELIAKKSGAGACIIHFILDKGKTERSIFVENRGNNERIEIGTDTRELLIGIFSSRPLARPVIERTLQAVQAELANVGITELFPLPDPIPGAVENAPEMQLALV